jgi:hypothetical protein
MRLWSIHPRHLDRMGLLGLWREALQAQRILKGGPPYKVPYGHHPQMDRFKDHAEPMIAIGQYLTEIFSIGVSRGYEFNRELIEERTRYGVRRISIPRGQINYEIRMLLHKLSERDVEKMAEAQNFFSDLGERYNGEPPSWAWGEVNSVFMVDNENRDCAPWERVKETYN